MALGWLALAWAFAVPALAVETKPEIPKKRGFVRVIGDDFAVLIPKLSLVFETGSRLPLFQQNDHYFIALVRDREGRQRLAAFPLAGHAGKSAWVSRENDMFFAFPTAACNGKLYLRFGDELPVVRETEREYIVMVERLGRRAEVAISKRSDEIEYVEFPPPPPPKPAGPVVVNLNSPEAYNSNVVGTLEKGGKIYYIYGENTAAESQDGESGESGGGGVIFRISSLFSGGQGQGQAQGKAPARAVAPEPTPEPAPAKPSPPVKPKPGAKPAPPAATNKPPPKKPMLAATNQAPAAKPSPKPVAGKKPDASAASTGTTAATMGSPPSATPPARAKRTDWVKLISYSVAGLMGLFVLSAGAVSVARKMQLKARTVAKPEAPAAAVEPVAAEPIAAPELVEPAVPPPPLDMPPVHHTDAEEHHTIKMPSKPKTETAFSGSLGNVSLGSVAQFLNSDRESGVLNVKCDIVLNSGSITFVDGEIVDATSNDKRGVDAVYQIMRCRSGHFAFSRGKKPDIERTVHEGTIALLMEAHRLIDEEKG